MHHINLEHELNLQAELQNHPRILHTEELNDTCTLHSFERSPYYPIRTAATGKICPLRKVTTHDDMAHAMSMGTKNGN